MGVERMVVVGGDRRETKQTKQKVLMNFLALYIPACGQRIAAPRLRRLTSPATDDREHDVHILRNIGGRILGGAI